jgi:hypothetical protein
MQVGRSLSRHRRPTQRCENNNQPESDKDVRPETGFVSDTGRCEANAPGLKVEGTFPRPKPGFFGYFGSPTVNKGVVFC